MGALETYDRNPSSASAQWLLEKRRACLNDEASPSGSL
jgi:hypothetical protein